MIQEMTAERRSEVLRLAGEEILNPTPGINQHAVIQIMLPFSSAGIAKKPFDTTLLDSPITISVQFNNSDSFYIGTGTRPLGFISAIISTAQGDLQNKSQSLRGALVRQPSMRYSYPFIHSQSIPINVTSNFPLLNINQITGFINADLIAISFGYILASEFTGTGSASPSPFNYARVTDVTLDFNGTVMYKAINQDYRLYNMQDELGASYVENSVIAPADTAPFTSLPVNSYVIAIDFSQLPSYSFSDRFYNTFRIGNNTMNLSATLPTAGNYFLFLTYHYNGIISVNGDANIFFD